MGKLVVAAIVSFWVIPLSILFNRIVPEPYMDEIFHVPQAKEYCRGNFRSWDPMITTPPGLYYLSLFQVASLFPGMYLTKTIQSFRESCSTAMLRSTNGVLAVLCSVLVYEIITCLRPNLSDKKATFISVVMALYPLHWFFTFMYYTDVASLTTVLAMYLMCLKRKYKSSALLGALAVLIRQTNILWILLVACSGIIDITLVNQRHNEKIDESIRDTDQSSAKNVDAARSDLRKRKTNGLRDMKTSYAPSRSTSSPSPTSGLLDEIQTIILTSWNMKWKLLFTFTPFLVVFMAFVAFLHWNGSVVLGAKEAHMVSLHFAQTMYFSLVCVLFTAPLHFTPHQVRNLFQTLWKNGPFSLLYLVALAAGFVSVRFFSIAHPYLLADNRHYPFYLWRKIINAHWAMKYLLVPVYVVSWFSILNLLGKSQRKIWLLAYFLATCAVLVPAPLIEFRYYTIPFYFFILHSEISNSWSWILMGILYIGVNVFTMLMFLFRPFHWSHEPGVQRFIW